MWLPKPLYEFVPIFHLVAGACLLAGSFYLDYWYWPTICLVGSVVCVIGGLVVLLKRRDFRYSAPAVDLDEGN